MEEIKLKKLTVFILETIMLQKNSTISEGFAYMFNEFIYKCYQENKEALSIIYDTKMLEEFIDNNYEVLSYEQMVALIERYRGFDGYIKLLDDIGLDTANKLNQLALSFIAFQEEMLSLYYADSNEYFPKGYPKILQ